jgi:copper transport protein
MSLWIGGLVLLALALPAASRALLTADKTRLLAATLRRFSPIAFGAVIALVTTGVIQAIVHVGSFGHLLDTPFGRAVLIKIGLVLVLIGLGYYNQRRALPALERAAERGDSPGAPGVGVRRSLRTEIALLAVVIGVTSALVSYAPASGSAPSGPFAKTKTAGPIQMQLTVDPARVGANAVHLYLLDAKTGAPYTATKDLTVSARLPSKSVGPLQLTARKAGPGHYVMDSALFGLKGKWDVRLTDRVSGFDQYQADFTVPVR